MVIEKISKEPVCENHIQALFLYPKLQKGGAMVTRLNSNKVYRTCRLMKI